MSDIRRYSDAEAFAFLDGELDPVRASGLEQAAARDTAVAALLDEAREARRQWRLVAQAAEPEPADWERIDRAILAAAGEPEVDSDWFEPHVRSGSPRRVWLPLAIAAALAAALGVGYLATRTQPSPDSAPAVAVIEGAAVPVDAVIAAGAEPRQVHVAEATLTLAPAAVCRVVEKAPNRTVVEVSVGRVTFDVAPRPAGAVFQVQAGRVVVTVVGTRFTVERGEDGGIRVTVAEGIVRVRRGREQASTLRAGDALRMAPQPVVVAHGPAAEEPLLTPEPPELVLESAMADAPPEERAEAEEQALALAAVDVAKSKKATAVSKVAPRGMKARVRRRAKTPGSRVPHSARRLSVRGPNEAIAADVGTQPAEPPTTAAVAESSTSLNTVSESRSVVVEVAGPAEIGAETEVSGSAPEDGGGRALKRVLERLGKEPWGRSITALKAWRLAHPISRFRVTSTYAVGYCEFQRGNKHAANSWFSRLPKENRWLRSIRDFESPPRP